MPRFSTKAKEIMDIIYYNKDIAKAKSLMKKLTNPFDIVFGKLFITDYYFLVNQQDVYLQLLAEIENDGKKFEDQFIQFIINMYYCWHYLGVQQPVVSKEQSKNYIDKLEQSYQEIAYKDNWEKYYCHGKYYMFKASYERKIKNNITNALISQNKCIEAFSKIPEEGEYYSAGGYNNLGIYYLENGDFENAESALNRGLEIRKKYSNTYRGIFPILNLSNLNFLKGDLQQAKIFNKQSLDISIQSNRTHGIIICLTQKGFLLYQEGNYDDALKAYQESLLYRKQHDDLLLIFMGYYEIFEFYYKRFKTTKVKAFLVQAKQSLVDLQKLSETNSNNKTIINYKNLALAKILKYGNMRKRTKAADTFDHLLEEYPTNIEITLELIDLLFDDVLISEDQDTINEIDKLIVKINKVPLRNNPQAVFSYISQQIFNAKYNYYIKGDPNLAIVILNDAKIRINAYKLNNLINEIDGEIQVLESELQKWENVDISIKERIKTSEFKKYIQQALEIAEKQN